MTETSVENPRVLFVSAGVGTGHNEAAKAVIEVLPTLLPNVQIDFVDLMQIVPKWFRMYYAGGFKLMMTKLGWLYGFGFWMYNRPHRPGRSLIEKLRLAHERRVLRPLKELLLEKKPDLVINTHFLGGPAIARWIDQGLPVRQVELVTDVEVHRWWYSHNVSRWFVPSEYSGKQFQRWGIDPQQITVSGIPIRPKWQAPLDRKKIYREWDLPADKKIVLLCGGAEFTAGPVVKAARGIVEACPQACVVVLAGRNKELLAELSGLGYAADRLRPTGFTDRMPELAQVASLMVTKPGGITTAECLAKGLPMVFLRPVPGQEGGNAIYFERQGAGVITRTVQEIVDAVRQLLENPAHLEELSQNAGRLYRPSTDIICRTIAGMLKES
jgi:processive 1,2-diacylglycerol beta-glucosyltransferase